MQRSSVRRRSLRSRAGVLSAIAAAGLLVAACGSSNSSSTAGSAAKVTTTSGTVAKGSPLAIQFPNLQGSTQGVDTPEDSEAAQAAVDWINHHGGVQGRPLQLTVCDLLTTPASDVGCANSMAAAEPLAIVGGGVDNGTPIVTSAAKAGIPYVTAVCNAPLELTSPDSHCFTPGNTGGYDAVASNEHKDGGKLVSLVLIAAAGAEAEVQQAASPTFEAQGVRVKVVLTSPTGEADLTPVIQTATQPPVSGVELDEDPTTCIAGLNAKGTLAVSFSIRFYADLACETTAVVKGAGPNADGVFFWNIGAISDKSDPDWPIYNSAMNQFAPGVTHLGQAPDGFIGIMDLYRVMLTMGATPINRESLALALNAATHVKGFLGSGATFTCNGSVFKNSPAICGNTTYLEKYTTQGGFSYVGSSTIPPGS